MKKHKKFILILILTLFLIGSFCLAQRKLEIQYPPMPGVEPPTTLYTTLPDYVRYLFTLIIIFGGIVAFIAMVWGGIKYLTSAGAPAKLSDARDQIFAGILGLIILLSSYLILNTINPQLVGLRPPGVAPPKGLKIYSNPPTPAGLCRPEEGSYILLIGENRENLTTAFGENAGFNNPLDTPVKHIQSLEIFSEPNHLTIHFYDQTNFNGNSFCLGDRNSHPDLSCGPNGAYYFSFATNTCYAVASTTDHDILGNTIRSNIVAGAKSIKIDWHIPGVYLFTDTNFKGNSAIYQADTASFPIEIDDKVSSLKIINPVKDGKIEYYIGAILHEDQSMTGRCQIFAPGLSDYPEGQEVVEFSNLSFNYPSAISAPNLNDRASSLTVFLIPKDNAELTGPGVRIHDSPNFADEYGDLECPPNVPETDPPPVRCCYPVGKNADWAKPASITDWFLKSDLAADGACRNQACTETNNCNDRAQSIEIKGTYLAVLFEHTKFEGKCEVFDEPDPTFCPGNVMCECGAWGRDPCLSSFIVLPTKK